jgi:two-component sensor histidine kinase
MLQNFFIQSVQGRIRAINRFCIITASMAAAYVVILTSISLYAHALVMSIVVSSFMLSVLLNRKTYFAISKICIIISTNFSVFYFSSVLGYRSGIHLYLYTSPLIAYLLFEFHERAKILIAFGAYLFTFLAVYAVQRYQLIVPLDLQENTIELLYVLNFTFSLILCFTLIFYFAYNNGTYTQMLTHTNEELEIKQEQLQQEITKKNKAQEELLRTLKEKEILLKEIHHRVKNNLAVVSGLVELQNFYVKDEKASAILKESRNRIKSIAVLHEKFYENKSLERIEIRSYVDELIYFIKLSFSNQNKDIRIHTQIDYIELSLVEALPFSLLLNELITNSYKHAFVDMHSGNIYLSLIKRAQEVVFHFKDDGCGFDFPTLSKDNSLGMNLVEAFSKQLKGKMTYESEKGRGVDFKLYFRVS